MACCNTKVFHGKEDFTFYEQPQPARVTNQIKKFYMLHRCFGILQQDFHVKPFREHSKIMSPKYDTLYEGALTEGSEGNKSVLYQSKSIGICPEPK